MMYKVAPCESLHVLIVEDDFFLAEDIVAILEHAGMVVVGPAPCPRFALELLSETDSGIDAALLDVRLGNEFSESVADELARSHIPFAFVTSDRSAIASQHRNRPVHDKPFTSRSLVAFLNDLLA